MKKIIAIAALAAASITTAYAAPVTVNTDGNGSRPNAAGNAQYQFDLDLAQSTFAPQFDTTVVSDAINANKNSVIASTHFKLPEGVARYVLASTISDNAGNALAATAGGAQNDATTGNNTIHGTAGDDAWINVVKVGDLQPGVKHISYTLTAYSD